MNRKEKQQRRPTVEEFLTYVPRRLDLHWSEDADGLVHITVPKFESKVGQKLCKILRKDQELTADMDAVGSLVWKHCDGKNTVADILKTVSYTHLRAHET